MTLPIFSKLFFLYVVFYLFAILGAELFGGKITLTSVKIHSPSSPPFYFLLNVNSYGASLVTLFHCMVVNNWFVSIEMYQNVIADNNTPYIFFTVFWCFTVLILLNVLIALVVEVYSSVTPEVYEKARRVKLVIQLNKMVKGVD